MTEAWLHDKFYKFRLGGEWFLKSDELGSFIESLGLFPEPRRIPITALRTFDMKRHRQESSTVIREWLQQNRGVMSRIARTVQPRVSPQFVRQVAWGDIPIDSGHRVYRELKDAGWPGVK